MSLINKCITTITLITTIGIGYISHDKWLDYKTIQEKEKVRLELKLDSLNCKIDSLEQVNKKLISSKHERAKSHNPSWESKALSCLGIKYVFGSMSKKKGFDCSGLVLYALGKKRGGSLGSTARSIYYNLKTKTNKREKGTLIFFDNLSHVGIMIDKNRFIHASCSKGVTVSKLDSYWSNKVYGYKKLT